MPLETKVSVFDSPDLDGAIFIEGSPTAGAAGILAVNYLREVFDAVLVGEIVSPHFPQISIINDDGIASRPKLELYLVKVRDVKLLLLSRAFPVEGNEGSYEVASKIYQFLVQHKVKEYIILASGRISGEGSVFVSTTNLDQSKSLLDAGAKRSPSLENLPVDRTSGFLMLFFARDKRKVSMLFSDTSSYMPDHLAAKKLLEVVSRYLNVEIDFTAIDREIDKQARMIQEMEQLGLTRAAVPAEERPSKEPFYIG
ncbi:MAG: PAC2 family protein [Candidatus Caldarchaeum sp.]|uniref:Proteasome assembly chaperone family protein n=1 Tax=Caldiarchaeum subterraneum TaxID=311458 RepID=A0A7C5YAI9_CALS0